MGRIEKDIDFKYLGVILALFTFIFAQFVEIALFNVGGFQVSAQKLSAFILFPIALLFMRRIEYNKRLIYLLIVVISAYTFSHILNLRIDDLVLTIFTLLSGFLGAIVLFTAFSKSDKALKVFAKIWLMFSVVTSIICILQAMGLVPILAVSTTEEALAISGGVLRGSGLKEDPNFQAFMLSLGLVFFFSLPKKNWIYFIIIIGGVIATFSRMGMVLSVVIILCYYILQSERKIDFKSLLKNGVKFLVIITLIGSLVYIILPDNITTFVDNRFQDVGQGINLLFKDQALSILSKQGKMTSGEQRVVVAVSGLVKFSEHYLIGVGAFRTDDAIGEITGFDIVSHNTYIELMLIGGIFGIYTMYLYGKILMRVFKNKLFKKSGQLEFSFWYMFVITFMLACLLLSFTYNSIFWLPAVIALFYKKKYF